MVLDKLVFIKGLNLDGYSIIVRKTDLGRQCFFQNKILHHNSQIVLHNIGISAVSTIFCYEYNDV